MLTTSSLNVGILANVANFWWSEQYHLPDTSPYIFTFTLLCMHASGRHLGSGASGDAARSGVRPQLSAAHPTGDGPSAVDPGLCTICSPSTDGQQGTLFANTAVEQLVCTARPSHNSVLSLLSCLITSSLPSCRDL